MASVRIKGKYTVKPAAAANSSWSIINSRSSSQVTIKLSELDEVIGPVHVPTIYFYNKPTPEPARNNSMIINTLKDSLSQALAHYYPLAGRIHELPGGRLELRVGPGPDSSPFCNDFGAELIEAESDSRLADFDDFTSPEKFQHLIPSVDMELEKTPLLIVQLTYLGCGGLSLGFLISHAVTDGTGIGYFLNDWSRLARGESLELYPCHDRSVLRAGEPPKEERELHAPSSTVIIDQQPPVEVKTKTVSVKLTKTQIETLKKAAAAFSQFNTTSISRPYTRFEVLASHIWRSVCKARGGTKYTTSSSTKSLGISIDARHRLLSFPPKYFGNSSFVIAAQTQLTDLLACPLSHTCNKIRASIELVDSDYLWSEIDFFKNLKDLSICRELRALSGGNNTTTDGDGVSTYVQPDVGVISWLSLPIFGLDFGWGKEVYMSPGELRCDGVTHLLPGHDEDGSVVVLVCLRVEHVEEFVKHFYQDIE